MVVRDDHPRRPARQRAQYDQPWLEQHAVDPALCNHVVADQAPARIEVQDDQRLGFQKADSLLQVTRHFHPRTGDGTAVERFFQRRDHQAMRLLKRGGGGRPGAFANQRRLGAQRLA